MDFCENILSISVNWPFNILHEIFLGPRKGKLSMTTSLASQAPSEYLEHFSAYQSACEKSLSFCKINKSTTIFHSLYCTLLGQKNDVKMFKTHTQVKPQATGKWFHWKNKFSTSLREHPSFLAQVSSFTRWEKLETWAEKTRHSRRLVFNIFMPFLLSIRVSWEITPLL